MAETFNRDFRVGNNNGKDKTFHFKKVWYDGFINLKYTITCEGFLPMHMGRNEDGEWKFENPIQVSMLCLPMEKYFARVIQENENQTS